MNNGKQPQNPDQARYSRYLHYRDGEKCIKVCPACPERFRSNELYKKHWRDKHGKQKV